MKSSRLERPGSNTDGNKIKTASLGVLFLLTACNISSYIDRVILNLMIGPIRHSLHISDTAISLLQGLAFAAFYTIAIIPIGRLVDSVDRTRIIGFGGFGYAASTFLCGAARRYWTLFIGRLGVGAGESTLQPAAYSILSELFSRERLPAAISVLYAGAYVGIGAGYVFGGWIVHMVADSTGIILPILGHVEGWQLTFMAAAIPSIFTSSLVLVLLKDSRRERPNITHNADGLRPFISFVASNLATFIPLLLACAMGALLASSGLSWTPTFFIRTYGMSEHEVGTSIGVIIMVVSPIGVLAASYISGALTRLGQSDAPLLVAALGIALTGAVGVVMPLMPNKQAALSCLVFREMFQVIMFPLLAASILIITPREIRGRIAALQILVQSIAGNFFGPTVTALMSDHIFTRPSGVRFSIATVYGAAAFVTVLSLLIARRPFNARLAAASTGVG